MVAETNMYRTKTNLQNYTTCSYSIVSIDKVSLGLDKVSLGLDKVSLGLVVFALPWKMSHFLKKRLLSSLTLSVLYAKRQLPIFATNTF